MDDHEFNKKMREALSMLGKRGGSAKSERKTLAAKRNGKKGGRPPLSQWEKALREYIREKKANRTDKGE